MQQITRPVLFQPFSSFILTVLTTPTPMVATSNKSDLVDSFVVSVDAGAANNVFMGDQNVSILSGIEIVAGGGPANFVIDNQNQNYDVQIPLMDIARTLQCAVQQPFAIPFIVWDCSQLYFVAVANTSVRIMLFRSQFV
jgi:hypothetical protein